MRFRSWSSLVQAAVVVTGVALSLGVLALLASAQADELDTVMGAAGLMSLSLMILAAAIVLWVIIAAQLLVPRCRNQH